MESAARVLLVTGTDDSVGGARVLAALRRSEPDAQVSTAHGLSQAVQAARDRRFDCILVTKSATGAGWEPTLQRIRAVAPHAGLVAIVADARPDGVDDFLDPDRPTPSDVGRAVRCASAQARARVTVHEATEQMARFALQDPLTGVLNRRGLENALVKVCADRDRGSGPVALLLDCDDFKSVNDNYGYAAGDAVLRAIADALTDTVRAGDYVARVGGDEFMVVFPHARTGEAMRVADRLRVRALEAVRALPEHLPDVSVSIGVQRLAVGITSVTEVVRATQAALRESKVGGKNRVTLQGDESGTPPPSRSQTPIYVSRHEEYRVDRIGSLADGALVGWEIRSHSNADVTEELYRHAVKRAALPAVDVAWFRGAVRRAPGGEAPIHVAVFPSTLQQVGSDLLEALPSRVSPERLCVSIDEQFLSGDPWHLRAPIDMLRQHGTGITLDISDFGRTTLEGLVMLRPDQVRIDQQRVTGVAQSVAMRAGLQRFVRVCQALEAEVIACGVVNDEDLEVLLELQVRWGVGSAVREQTATTV